MLLGPITELTQLPEPGSGLLGPGDRRRDRHQSMELDVLETTDLLKQLEGPGLSRAVLRGFLGEIQLNQDRLTQAS